jgi:hypothetical protein
MAENPVTPEEILHILAKDEDRVCCAIAENPNTPRDTLAVLAEDLNPGVAQAALQRFHTEDEK